MLHDMPVGLVPGTAGLVPGLVAVSSPVAIRRFSSRSHHRFNMADVDCIRTFVRIHYPTGRRRTVATVSSPVVPAPPDSVATVRPDSVATVPPDSVATVPPDSVATPPLLYCLPSLRSFQHPPFRLLCSEMQAKQDGGRRADVDSNVQ